MDNLTDKQKAYLEAYKRLGTARKVAEELGVSHQVVSSAIAAIKKKTSVDTGTATKEQLDSEGLKILVITDMQIRPNIDLKFAHCIGKYILSKRPDVVINLGDMADMESLSSYDKGKRSYEGRRFRNDVESVVTANKILWGPVEEYNKSRAPNKQYKPRRVFLIGNHEDRITRAVEMDPMLEGTIGIESLELNKYWGEVHDFKKVVVINGVAFSHYFPTGAKGLACSTASAQLKKMHMSCIAGHQQGRQTYSENAADGRRLTSIIAGSCYDYYMEYMGPQGNKHWRGIIMLHSVKNGEFDEVYVPTEYLKRKYANDMPPMYYAPEE